MRKILSLIILALLLTGCTSEPIGEFTNMKVASKRMEEECGRGCWNDYYITFERDGIEVELETDSENEFNLLKEGNIVDVSYSKEYFIKEITFPTLDKKNTKD